MELINDAGEPAPQPEPWQEFTGCGADVAASFSVPARAVAARFARAAEEDAPAPDADRPAVSSASANPSDHAASSLANPSEGERSAASDAASEPAPEPPVPAPVQHRILQRGMLHNVNGRLGRTGWMTAPLLRYDRGRVKANHLRLKEWDRYCINDDEYALWITVADFGYVGVLSAQVTNLVHPSSKTVSVVVPLPGRRLSLPAGSQAGITRFKNRRCRFVSRMENGQHRITATFEDFMDGESLAIDALLDCPPAESLANVSSWEDDARTFHYHRIVPAFRASGSVKVGRHVHGFSPTRSFGLFSWNRGLWPLETQRTWAVAQGWQDGHGGAGAHTHKAALQLVAGMDDRASTQNAFFLDGRVVKLEDVEFSIPEGDPTAKDLGARYNLLGAWKISDRKGLVDLTFVPANDSADKLNAAALFLDRHQVAGDFSGTVQVDGYPFVLHDLHGTAAVEHVRL